MRVLIVEDDPDHVMLLQRVLERAPRPVEVSVARNGRSALEQLASGELPDLILLDLNMPVLDGFEVLAARRDAAEFAEVPTVVVTTSTLDADRERVADLGADDFVIKSGYSEFKVTVHRLIERYWTD